MTASDSALLLAFDIGAKTHSYAQSDGEKNSDGTVENSPALLRTFLKQRLRKGRRVQVIMEATGSYFLDLALLADELGAEVYVVNPKAAHNFALALSQRSKTDKIDARMLLEFLRRMPLERWQSPAREYLQLRLIGRYMVQLGKECVAAKNRLHAMESTQETPKLLLKDARHSIQELENRIEALRDEACRLIEANDQLCRIFAALLSIIGMGRISAVSVLAELCVLSRSCSSRACTSHAGLDVRRHQSGTSVNRPGRITKHGNKYLRRALYMPALSAGIHDPSAAAFKQRLLGKGKKPLQVNTAIMRKMLTVAWAMVKDPQPYDGKKLYADIKKA